MGRAERTGLLLVRSPRREGAIPPEDLDARLGDGYDVVGIAESVTGEWPTGDVDCLLVEAPPGAALVELRLDDAKTDRDVAVVAVVADDETEAAEFLQAGADEVLRSRPGDVDPAVLEARIDSALARRETASHGHTVAYDRRGFFERAVDVVDDVFYVTDPQGNLVVWNEALGERTGYADDEIAELSPADLVADDEWAEAVGDADRVAGLDEPGIELDLRTKAGDRIPHEFRVATLAEESTGETHRVVVARDVTDRRRRERELRHQNERLEEFADSVAHDVRNPLEVANAGVEIARLRLEDGDEEGVGEALDDVGEALDRIDAMVENVLELARGGRTVVEPSAVSLASVAEAAWAEVPSGEATLETPDGAVSIAGDLPRVRRLLANLFRNAVEHNDPGVAVRVGTLPEGFYVADDGRGIPPSERSLVLESGYTTGEEGTGFGLAIVREIAEAHDWTMAVTESEDGGARFEFRDVEFHENEE